MTTQAISSALSGLRLAQQGLDVTAANVANAQTEGYTRKILPQENVFLGNSGVGVRAGEIQRYVDQALLRDYRAQIGVETGLTVRESYLARIQSFHGSSDQETNLASRLGALSSSFVTLSATPDSVTAQQVVVDQADAFAKSVNKYANFLSGLRSEVQNSISDEVSNINMYLKDVADYNKRMTQLKHVGSSTATLEDQRDSVLKKLSESIDISYFEDGDGTVVVQTKDGKTLADLQPYLLSFNANGMTYNSAYPDTLSGVTVNGGAGINYDLASPSAQTGGRLGALLKLRDNEIPSYIGQIDELAHKVAARFEAQGLTLFTDNNGGVPFNTPASYAGFALNIQVNPAVANDPKRVQQGTTGWAIDTGSTEVINKIINYTFGRYADASGTPHPGFNMENNGPGGKSSFVGLIGADTSLDEFTRAILSRQAEQHSLVSTSLTNEKSYKQDVQKRLLDGSSVNTDEEMARLIELQKHYSASAKMIGALDDLFKELLTVL